MKITFCLAGTVITITFLDQTRQVAHFYETIYRKFIVDKHPADANLTVRFLPCTSAQLPCVGGEENPHFEMVIPNEQAALWLGNQPKETDGFSIESGSVAIRLLNTVLLFSPETRTGRIYLAKNEDQPFRCLYHLLWIFSAQILGERGGCCLHAAALVKNMNGYIFSGDSGAGKSSLAVRWPQDGILSDEGPIITGRGNDLRVFPSPFNQLDPEAVMGNQDAPGGCRVQGLYFLVQNKTTYIERASFKTSLSLMISRRILFFPFLSSTARAKLFDIFFEICNQIPMNFLYLQKDADFWKQLSTNQAEV